MIFHFPTPASSPSIAVVILELALLHFATSSGEPLLKSRVDTQSNGPAKVEPNTASMQVRDILKIHGAYRERQGSMRIRELTVARRSKVLFDADQTRTIFQDGTEVRRQAALVHAQEEDYAEINARFDHELSRVDACIAVGELIQNSFLERDVLIDLSNQRSRTEQRDLIGNSEQIDSMQLNRYSRARGAKIGKV